MVHSTISVYILSPDPCHSEQRILQHLHRKLKELTNQSTRDLIRNVRLKQAASLLANQYHNITEVASLTGFTNIAYFSTAFKELYGVPPTSYMEEQQKSSFSDGDKIEQQN